MRRTALTILLSAFILTIAGSVSPSIRYYETFATLSVARTLRTNGLSLAALPFYTIAMKLEPQAAMIPQARALAYQSMGDHQAALADFNQAISMDSGDMTTYALRARSLHALAKYEEAILDYSKLISAGAPEDKGYALIMRGTAHYRLKHLSKAKQDFAGAIETMPSWIKGYLLLANVEVETGELDAALATLKKGEAMACNLKDLPPACTQQLPKLREAIARGNAAKG